MSEQHERAHRIVTPMAYLAVYLGTLAGLGLTILAAYRNLGVFNPIVVLAIAFAQAAMVALFTMHLKNSTKLNKLSVGASLFVLAILVGLVLVDYVSRAWGSW
jgi:cytochrome c oxidase subunit 4